MHDAYLKFAGHAEAAAMFSACGLAIAGGETVTYHDTGLPTGMLVVKAVGGAMDGIVYAATGETDMDADGGEYPVMAAVEGFHVNLRLEDGAALPESLSAFEVAPEPATPSERFA